ncbi:hypothetical protein ElyMa_004771500 [Elysia marginata]|uniref:Uncharacterized protein n=1 Tax=Elysia marginata TaxID=1093978 RepID=A0AAV4IE35_9GAST|nr:hypothetical protein ElyMa_004771500 [Elysia marginata]
MKTVCEGRLDGRIRKGRPPISLVTNLTTACGFSLHQIVQKSQDRAGWQQKVRSSIATANTASGDADRPRQGNWPQPIPQQDGGLPSLIVMRAARAAKGDHRENTFRGCTFTSSLLVV